MVRDLAAQGVQHAEVYVSFGIIYFWKQAEVEPFVEAVERGRVRGGKRVWDDGVLADRCGAALWGGGGGAGCFGRRRSCGQRYPAIVGIGIGGDEARGRAELFREPYAEAKAAGLRLTAHAGETTGPESIWAALNIGAERMGHALSAQQDAELMQVLAEKQIPLEINVTSNIRTGWCAGFDVHPVREYFDRGLMVTINSDDPPMFGSNLLEEYVLVQEVTVYRWSRCGSWRRMRWRRAFCRRSGSWRCCRRWSSMAGRGTPPPHPPPLPLLNSFVCASYLNWPA